VDILGIDVGKNDLHAALLGQGNKSWSKSVSNTATGIAQLRTWLKNRKTERLHVCLEATGGWSEEVALVLHQDGHVVSIVNPSRIKAFAASEMLRTKTDNVDAALIARFCRLHQPAPWSPPAPEILTLQALVRRYQGLARMYADEENRLGAPAVTPQVRTSIEAIIRHLKAEMERINDEIEEVFKKYPPLRKQRELLISIPGIGETTAARILGEIPNIAQFRDVKAVAAFVGLSPRHYQSGSIRRPSRLSKTGNARLRSALFFPAMAAMKWNPIVRGLAERMSESGKAKMSRVAAAMRKLLVLAYGVLKSGRPFDPAYAS
jgi:transposase